MNKIVKTLACLVILCLLSARPAYASKQGTCDVVSAVNGSYTISGPFNKEITSAVEGEPSRVVVVIEVTVEVTITFRHRGWASHSQVATESVAYRKIIGLRIGSDGNPIKKPDQQYIDDAVAEEKLKFRSKLKAMCPDSPGCCGLPTE